MQRNLKLFLKTFVVCAVIGCTLDYLFNGFQIVFTDVMSDLVMDLLLAIITVCICGEVKQKMSSDAAMDFLQNNSLKVIEDENTVVGVLGKYKQFFVGNLEYDKRAEVLVGSKMLVKAK